MKHNGLHVWEVALAIGVALFLVVGTLSLQAQAGLAQDMVRLHVLANSDSEEDQALKLLVRDAVLEEATALLEDVHNQEDARLVLRENLSQLQAVAQAAVYEQGYGYNVEATLEMTEFPTKYYDGFTLPAGEYFALRILIGAVAGENWWCVVFPPLCTTAATEFVTTAMSAGLEEAQIQLITADDGYVLKLKSVEWWSLMRQKLEM